MKTRASLTTLGLVTACLLLQTGLVFGAIQLPSHFSDHMVLQRETKVPVWGTAEPGEEVAVEFAGQRQVAKTAPDGKWRVYLDPMAASEQPGVLVIKGSVSRDPVEFRDVLVGEVWLCSGQSNMDFTVAKTEKYYFAGVQNEAEEVAAANYPRIRMFTSDSARSYEPRSTIPGCAWKVCTPENVREFSAVGYFFARDLQKEIKVPVGILTLTYGASTCQAWIRREALAASAQLRPMLEEFDAAVKAAESPTNRLAREAALKDWERSAATAKAEGKKAPRKPKVLDPVKDQHNPTVLFNGVVAPVVPFALRGVLWYQGESITTGGVALYPLLQSTLIQDWRQLWGCNEMPFYICQIAAYGKAVTDPNQPGRLAATREAQASVLSLPHTGMGVTIDIGNAHNVHPKNKQDVGNRLARIALAKVYGRNLEYSGPVFESMRIENGAARLTFSHADGGLVAKGGRLAQFAVAGPDRKFVWAEAKLDGASVVVSHKDVPNPVAVRYAWADNPEGCNLYNQSGLPAAPFRTDKW